MQLDPMRAGSAVCLVLGQNQDVLLQNKFMTFLGSLKKVGSEEAAIKMKSIKVSKN